MKKGMYIASKILKFEDIRYIKDRDIFYIGEVKPGNNKLDVDLDYIPPSYQPIELSKQLKIVSNPELLELKDGNIHLNIRK